MPLPGASQPNTTANPTPQEGVRLNTEKKVFELAPAGMQPAVLAEIVMIQVEEPVFEKRKKTDKTHVVDKILLCFELAATYQDSKNEFFGKRVIISTDTYPSFSDPKHKLMKLCLSWANKKSFTDAEKAEWADAIQAPSFLPDGKRNPASLVGAACTLHIVHGVGKASGRDYAAIENIMSPSPGYENLTISADYTPYAERQRQIELRRQEREAQQQSGQSHQSTQKDEFRGQF